MHASAPRRSSLRLARPGDPPPPRPHVPRLLANCHVTRHKSASCQTVRPSRGDQPAQTRCEKRSITHHSAERKLGGPITNRPIREIDQFSHARCLATCGLVADRTQSCKARILPNISTSTVRNRAINRLLAPGRQSDTCLDL
jgi:hypothetical protein